MTIYLLIPTFARKWAWYKITIKLNPCYKLGKPNNSIEISRKVRLFYFSFYELKLK